MTINNYDIIQEIESAIEIAYTIDIQFDEPDGKFDFKVKKGWYKTPEKDLVMKYARSRRIEAIVRAVIYSMESVINYKKATDAVKLFTILKDDAQVALRQETAKVMELSSQITQMKAAKQQEAQRIAFMAEIFGRYVTGEMSREDVDWLREEMEKLYA